MKRDTASLLSRQRLVSYGGQAFDGGHGSLRRLVTHRVVRRTPMTCLVAMSFLAACQSSTAGVPTRYTPATKPAIQDERNAAPSLAPSRSLRAGGTFGELVWVVEQLVARGKDTASDGCLIGPSAAGPGDAPSAAKATGSADPKTTMAASDKEGSRGTQAPGEEADKDEKSVARDKRGKEVEEDAEGWYLGADLHPGVSPLPRQPRVGTWLDAGPQRAVVFTPAGMVGKTDRAVAFATFTSTPAPKSGVSVVLVTTTGLRVLRTDKALPKDMQQTVLSQLGAHLQKLGATKRDSIIVSADSLVSLRAVAQTLEALQEAKFEAVALAAMFDPGTKLPSDASDGSKGEPDLSASSGDEAEGEAVAESEGGEDSSELCEDGLPPFKGKPGEVTASQTKEITESLKGFREHAAACISEHAAEVAFGGKLYMLMRLVDKGKIDEVCFSKDETGSSALRACLMDTMLRETQFPEVGSQKRPVDLALPLTVPPSTLYLPKPICDASAGHHEAEKKG